MQSPEFIKLTGVVEVDEMYIGGKAKNRHGGGIGGGTPKGKGGRGASGKVTVIGAISRKGNVIAQVIERTDTPTLTGFVDRAVSDQVRLLATDEHPGYRTLGMHRNHQHVEHARKEYVRGEVHTQTIDAFWSLLKRGIVGTFHQVTKDCLPLYLNEFMFRHNNREHPNMFGTVVRAS